MMLCYLAWIYANLTKTNLGNNQLNIKKQARLGLLVRLFTAKFAFLVHLRHRQCNLIIGQIGTVAK